MGFGSGENWGPASTSPGEFLRFGYKKNRQKGGFLTLVLPMPDS